MKNSKIPSFFQLFGVPYFFFLPLMLISYTKKEKKYHFQLIIENMIWKKSSWRGESNPRSLNYGAKVQTITPTGLAILASVYEKSLQSITFLNILIFFEDFNFFLHFVKNTKTSNTLWPNFFTSMLSDVYSMPTTKHFFCKLLQKILKSKNVTWGTK